MMPELEQMGLMLHMYSAIRLTVRQVQSKSWQQC